MMQRLRSCALEILHRLPMTPVDVLEPYAPDIVDTLMNLVQNENEDNAVLCMKIIMDFQRQQAKALTDRVQPFLDFIQRMFRTMEEAVKEAFDPPSQTNAPTLPSTPNNPATFQSPRPGSPLTLGQNASTSSSSGPDLGLETVATRPLPKGLHSFKVLAECPIIVVSLFHSHRHCVSKNVKEFVPLIKTVLLLEAGPQERAHAEAQREGRIFTGVSPQIKNRVAFGDFITAQVKTMSFLAYLLRVCSDKLSDFIPALPNIVVRLLKDCPRERSSARKELLVAIRHIINFNYRKVFMNKIDELLDEQVLIGDGLTVYETMRPLAYSMLADLIHHVRDGLGQDQIRRTIEVYTRNLHDDFPGTSFQTMSAKLLLNMAESIARLPEKRDARHFLIMILNAIGDKFAAMNRQYANAVKISESDDGPSLDAGPDVVMMGQDDPPDWDETDIFHATPIRTSSPRDRGTNPVADNKFLFKNLMNGLKNMFYQLKACNPEPQPVDAANTPPSWSEVSYGYNAEEVAVITKLFREGASVFRYYSPEKPVQEPQSSSPIEFLSNHHHLIPSSKEEKDLLETFATVFHCVDPATFHEVFHSEIPRLYELTFDHTALLHIPQFFLASEATSPSFAGMLLNFLMDHLDEVGHDDFQKTSVLLRLFKLSFMAVTLFSAQNEQVLLPHVTKILTRSIQLSTMAEEPMNYFLLLRSLFRSIGGGRFELLYKEILPLLEMTLDVFNTLMASARKTQERDLYVELCLTVPARLSNLLPHLSNLMRPLVVALQGGPDLVSQGLRTLELCVDNLTADYLDPIIAPVMPELMKALWTHLRPAPYSHFHSHTTMRILGKLGGRNRKFLTRPPSLEYRPYADEPPRFEVTLNGSNKGQQTFPACLGIELATSQLMETPKTEVAKKSDAFYKQQAFQLISTQLKLFIGVDNLPDDFAQLVRLQARDLLEANLEAGPEPAERGEYDRSIAKKDDQERTFKQLMKACIYAVSIPELREEALKLVVNVCRHLTILEIGRALAQLKRHAKAFEVGAGEGPLFIDSRVLANVVVETLASGSAEVRKTAEDIVHAVRDSAAIIFGSATPVDCLPFFAHLSKAFSHCCHEESWSSKAAGTFGIQLLLTRVDLGDAWLSERQAEFVRSLIFVVKDLSQDLPATTRIQAQRTLEDLLRRCNAHASRADLDTPSSRLSIICGYLTYELAHMNKNVRETAQRALSLVAEIIGVEIHELVAPVKDRLLSPIYNKPLRALPFATQIGYIDAITFCMGLQSGIVEFNDELYRLLNESLALADAEDDNLAVKLNEQRTAQLIVSLRVSCIRLLSIAMRSQDFGTSVQSQNRQRIISVFFKSLYSKSSEVIEAANAALRNVLTQQNKLPKDLLQHGLRPILMNLQDYKRLSIHGLDGLARLLTLLTSYFKVGIGDMLLGHLETLAEPNMLQRISFTLIEQNRQMRLIAAIVNIFHLLPAAAVSFMNTLVTRVLDLEEALRRTRYSPFRDPLIKYLNRYPNETWTYFSSRLSNLRYGRFFAQILAYESSTPLRDALTQDVSGLLRASLDLEDLNSRYTAAVNAIHAVHSVVTNSGGEIWILGQPLLRTSLMKVGKELETNLRKNHVPAQLRLPIEWAGEQLMDILIASMIAAPQNLDPLFDVIEAVTTKELKKCHSLYRYIYQHIIMSDNVDHWQQVVMKCLELSNNRTVTPQVKTFAFHYLVNPILARDIMVNHQTTGSARGSRLVDKTMTEAIHNKIWKPHLSDFGDDLTQPGVDHSRMELLQMSAMLIKYHHTLISDVRKDIIKFGWTSIRLEDIINKHAAYVVIAYFISSYESPSKIVIQVYVALLRACQNEGRSLVMQALDLIAPVMPKRVANTGDARNSVWARWPKKILLEDSSNLQQMTNIFQFLVRHPALFFDSREQFIPTIIQSLSKFIPSPNPSTESKKLALHLISLLWEWEQRRVKGLGSGASDTPNSPSTKRRKLDGSPADPTSSPAQSIPVANDQINGYTIPAQLRYVVIKFLIQLITLLHERLPIPSRKYKDATSSHSSSLPSQPPEMIRKALVLLYNLLSPGYWDDLDVDLIPKLTENILNIEELKEANEKKQATTTAINTLQIVRVLITFKPKDWIFARLPQLQALFDKFLRSEDSDIQACIHGDEFLQEGLWSPGPLLKRVLDAIPDYDGEEEEPASESSNSDFISFLTAVVNETIGAGNHVSSINVLWTLSRHKPSQLDQHLPQLMKALSNKLKQDYLTAATAPATPATTQSFRAGDSSIAAPDPNDLETFTDLVLKAIDILALRISVLGDLRRYFLITLATLLEKSQDNRIGLKILDMVEKWVFSSVDAFPTLKEKTAILHKMILFETRTDPLLLSKFLNLIIRIYEDPVITRTELTVRLEHAFLIGTRAQDVEMRSRFMGIFCRSISPAARARISYVMTEQNWDTLADSFWLSQASQLVMGSIEMGTPIRLQPGDFTTSPASALFASYSKDPRADDLMLDDNYLDFIGDNRRFCAELTSVRARDILEPLGHLQYLYPQLSHDVWTHLFQLCWASLSRDDRTNLERGMLAMLTKDYHQRQMDKRPNVVQSILEGVAKAQPTFKVPPHALKFLTRTYDTWYTAMFILEEAAIKPLVDTPAVRESNLDALVELYANLQEEDLFYGTWRRRCQYIDTNAALSYEQNGVWDKAQQLYEAAQLKARTGGLPFSEGEYMLWEDHWVTCAQKLQQWDILFDFAKHENFNDLLLECAWRQTDLWHGTEQREWLDSIVKGVMDAPTPRRSFFQAFQSLLKIHSKLDAIRVSQGQETRAEDELDRRQALQEFHRNVDEAVQLSIRKWHQLPTASVNAHIPLLHNFQELVELHDASIICASLSQTNQQNLDAKSQELKLLLGSWRDRLPNVWDDINAWQDLVTWRQHVFHIINTTYLTLLPQQAGSAAGSSSAYRGYHETAWIINRFAHVARKHQLPDVCISQLSRIYTLPNIEIQEAFLKLREQAKCHYQTGSDLTSGLDVIHNTNLNYFRPEQKAEFYTLKGMFLEKLGSKAEADEAFGLALYFNLKLAKAWAAWGQYSDNKFKAEPGNIIHAATALGCYLEAAGLFKNGKSRKMLSRVLWLISLDDAHGTVERAFESFKGETPVWYWITFLPQLLTSLSHKEARISHVIMKKVAKVYPQVCMITPLIDYLPLIRIM